MTFGDAFMRNYFVAYNKTGNLIGFSELYIIIIITYKNLYKIGQFIQTIIIIIN